MATMILLVGLPGAGKTTLAKQLAREHGALRLTPDEWMIPLFGEPDPNGKRDVLEGRMISVALQLLRLGLSVVLDLDAGPGTSVQRCSGWPRRWKRRTKMVYVPVDRATQLKTDRPPVGRRAARNIRRDIGRPRSLACMFEVPDAVELAGAEPPPLPPASWSSWLHWAEGRWPSLSIA